MQSGNSFYFAWCGIQEDFDPAFHARRDDRPLKIAMRHQEFSRRQFVVEFQPGNPDFLDGREAAHFSIMVNGVLRHLGRASPNKVSSVSRTDRIVVEFETIDFDDAQKQANLLAGIVSNPILYVPQIEEMQDPLDAEVALKATNLQLEWDKNGEPYLCSFFGDNSKFKVIDGSRVPRDSFQPIFDRTPPRGIAGKLTLSWVDYWSGEVDFSDAINAEINRIADHYGVPAGSGRFTFTPDSLQSWPKPGSTIADSYVVTESDLQLIDGPGVEPPTPSIRPPIKVLEPRSAVAGLPAESADLQGQNINTEIFSTGFSSPVLKAFGIRSRERVEEIFFYLPFQGQEAVNGNAEPLYIEKSASGLHIDPTVEEHEVGAEYQAGDRAKTSDVVFQCRVPHTSRDGLLNDMYDYDPWSVTKGEKLWEPVRENNSPLRFPNTSQAAISAFGRRAIQHFIRRMVAMLGLEVRVGTNPFDIPVEDAWELDTGYIVRLQSRFIKGGFLEGKVSEIEISADLNEGVRAFLTLKSALGSGNFSDDYEAPDDDGDGEDGQEPGAEYPVTSEGGEWDIVRYQAPLYLVPSLGSPEDRISVKIDWLGCEQQWALQNPGQRVWNPYGRIPTGGGTIPARSTIFVQGALDADGNPLGSDDWLQAFPTAISVFIDEGRAEDARPVQLSVPITFGWRGPKQMEI